MGEHGLGENFDIIRDHIVAARRCRKSLRGADERQRPANRDPQTNLDRSAAALHETGHVIVDRRVDVHGPGERRHLHEGRGTRDHGHHRVVRTHVRALEDTNRRGMVGISDRGFHDETIELRLGEAVGSSLFDGVLGGDHHERASHRMGHSVDRDLTFLHDLEQSRLGFRAGPIDLVGENDARENRAAVEVEGPGALVVDADPRDVAGEQVGRELNTTAGTRDALCHRPGERGLTGPGKVLEQEVPLRQQRSEGQADDEGFSEKHLIDIRHQPRERRREPFGLLGGHGHESASREGRARNGACGADDDVITARTDPGARRILRLGKSGRRRARRGLEHARGSHRSPTGRDWERHRLAHKDRSHRRRRHRRSRSS